MSPTTNPIDERAARAEVIAASIRSAFAESLRDPLDEALVTRAAAFIAYWNDLENAITDAGFMSASYDTALHTALLFYRSALQEAGNPDLIKARLLQEAEWAEARAVRHGASGREFAEKADQRQRGLWQMAADGEFEARAAAGFRCAAEERARGDALRRTARQVGRRAAA